MARTERGASAVEFAIVFPLLFLFLAAIIDFGRAYFYQVQLTNAQVPGRRQHAIEMHVRWMRLARETIGNPHIDTLIKRSHVIAQATEINRVTN